MCAQYLIRKNWKLFAEFFDLENAPEVNWTERILPYTPAPVVTTKGLQLMQYSLVPHWSPEKKVKFATYNARIESIEEKPTWKIPFRKHHCLVPISGFIEPIYEGELAGNMVEFYAKTPLVAAGIYDQWQDKKSNEVLESFALVMTEPVDFIRQNGHDRQPIFLRPGDAKKWLKNENEEPQILKNFLLHSNFTPPLEMRADRPLLSFQKKTNQVEEIIENQIGLFNSQEKK